ncbi:MAG: hypothetical protein JRN26_05520 [Nitrososphaerota archaeon]|jgi:hypothetical protein|nr:hypothetical protein [Nitrososphaerota archaeon]MDG6927184.1 hypothetical protein [Nitrososphaerota archaeon]MDG6930828.1 hypothetical protein [Nitrososphaerota archaeon]MDG6932272.1 hypothetical protein [Nitrososphaerota archaeon]MDG6936323.1 hypothetical protein [Nitrososphaerota archaeon]
MRSESEINKLIGNVGKNLQDYQSALPAPEGEQEYKGWIDGLNESLKFRDDWQAEMALEREYKILRSSTPGTDFAKEMYICGKIDALEWFLKGGCKQ